MATPDNPEREFIDPRTTPFAPIRSRGNLPHLLKENAVYFVTFRLRDALSLHPAPAIPNFPSVREILERSEPPLAAGSCALSDPALAAIVQSALLFFDGTRYRLDAWCVMPNHVHVIVCPLGDHLLSQILHSWKSFTSTEINKRRGTHGPFWESESFNHVIRSADDWEGFASYVENNPVAAGYCQRPEEWAFSSARRTRAS